MSGWEYKSDAMDEFREYEKGDAKIYTLAQLKKQGIKDPRGEWKYVKLSGTRPRKKTTKKVGAVRLLPVHQKYFKQVTEAKAKELFKNNKEVFGLDDYGTEALIEDFSDFNPNQWYAYGVEKPSVGKTKKVGNSTTGYKVIGKKNGQMVDISNYPMAKPDAMKFIKQQGIENYYTNVVVVPYRGKKAIKKLMGAVKKTPVKKPKVQKADVDMSALNGVIKYQVNKFYEVAKGANKGSVIKITSIRKAPTAKEQSKLYKSYNVKFYEFRNGHLQKPFDGTITSYWLDKRSVRPRPSVKASELKKYI